MLGGRVIEMLDFKNPIVLVGTILLVVFLLIFFLLAFGVQISGETFVIGGFVIALGVIIVFFMMLKHPPEEPMKAAIAFIQEWWNDTFHETLEEREIFLVTRWYGNDKHYGGTIRRGSGSVGRKVCIVIKKVSGTFTVEKAREAATLEEERNPFLDFATEYDVGANTPHVPTGMNRVTHPPPEKEHVQVNVGQKPPDEDDDKK
jgi:hypothetical protein